VLPPNRALPDGAISEGNVYTLAVSTHPFDVLPTTADRVYYQQHVPETVSRDALGT